jgi:hypothetical protein
MSRAITLESGDGAAVVYVGPEKSNVDEAIKRYGCGVSLKTWAERGAGGYIRRLMFDPRASEEARNAARRAFEERVLRRAHTAAVRRSDPRKGMTC